jgi:hypothetical protein
MVVLIDVGALLVTLCYGWPTWLATAASTKVRNERRR